MCAPTRAHALRMGPGPGGSNIVGRQIALRLVHRCLIADFTASTGSEVVDRRRAPPTRAHAPPGTPHRIVSQGGVESPVARGRAGSALTCSRQCIRNFGTWCASGDGLCRAAAGGQPARRRRCGRAGRGASLLPAAAALGDEVRALSGEAPDALVWHVWRSGEQRGAALGGVALAPMQPRRARCIIASSSGRAWR